MSHYNDQPPSSLFSLFSPEKFLLSPYLVVASAYAFKPMGMRSLPMALRAAPGTTEGDGLSPSSSSSEDLRRAAAPFAALSAGLLVSMQAALAEDAAPAAPPAPPKVVLGPPPEDFGLQYKFYEGTDSNCHSKLSNLFSCSRGCPTPHSFLLSFPFPPDRYNNSAYLCRCFTCGEAHAICRADGEGEP